MGKKKDTLNTFQNPVCNEHLQQIISSDLNMLSGRRLYEVTIWFLVEIY